MVDFAFAIADKTVVSFLVTERATGEKQVCENNPDLPSKKQKRTRVERVTSLVLGSNGQRQVEELEMLRKGRMDVGVCEGKRGRRCGSRQWEGRETVESLKETPWPGGGRERDRWMERPG